MQKVLFVCTANYFRSRFAEWFFNFHADAAGIEWTAESRGILAEHLREDAVAPVVVQRLEEDGIPLPYPVSGRQQLKDRDFRDFDRVIVMDREEHLPLLFEHFPRWYDQVDYWDVPDVDRCAPKKALSYLEQQVLALVDDLKQPVVH